MGQSSIGLFVPRAECVAQLVGERSKTVSRRRLSTFGVVSQLLSLLRISDSLGAETNPAACRINFEDDHFNLGAYGKCPDDICVLRDAGLAQRNEARASGRKKYKYTELLVTLDLSFETGARPDRRL